MGISGKVIKSHREGNINVIDEIEMTTGSMMFNEEFKKHMDMVIWGSTGIPSRYFDRNFSVKKNRILKRRICIILPKILRYIFRRSILEFHIPIGIIKKKTKTNVNLVKY